MNIADYWLMIREYSIWNTIIASLQFWTADLDPVTLNIATEYIQHSFIQHPLTHSVSNLMKYYLVAS